MLLPLADSVATATVFLAVVTLFLVAATWKLVRVTRRGTAEARVHADRQLCLIERQIRTGYRPLLIDVAPYAPVSSDTPLFRGWGQAGTAPTEDEHPRVLIPVASHPGGVEADPRRIVVTMTGSGYHLSLPLRNVGSGLAIIERDGIAISAPAIRSVKELSARPLHVPVNETTRIDLRVVHAGTPIEAGTTWRVELPYTDFVGEQRIVASFDLTNRGALDSWYVSRMDQRQADNGLMA